MRKSVGRLVIALVAGGMLGLAGGASAESGLGLMVDKDVAARTVTLKDGLLLRVSDETEILRRVGRSRQAMGFSDLSHAVQVGAGLEVRGEHQIEWQGRRHSSGVIAADRIEVLGALVE